MITALLNVDTSMNRTELILAQADQSWPQAWVQNVRLLYVSLFAICGAGCPLLAIQAFESISGTVHTGIQCSALLPSSDILSVAEPPGQADPDAVDKAKLKEIMGYKDKDDEQTFRKFLEFVILPLSVCFAMIVLFRRGLMR